MLETVAIENKEILINYPISNIFKEKYSFEGHTYSLTYYIVFNFKWSNKKTY
jgi:hypothetical protein